MDKIKLLQARRQELLNAGKKIREEIDKLIDKDSFVELSSYSFSESEFYDGKAEGEGVVCGFATIDDYPYYIVAQNFDVLCGGVSKANCEKIIKCLDQAEKNGAPVVYLLSSAGVRVGEGVNVLEGVAALLGKSAQISRTVTQYVIINGEVYGQISLLAGMADFVFLQRSKSILASNSPLVISAACGENLSKEKVGGAGSLDKTGLETFVVNDLSEIREKISSLNLLLNGGMDECDNLNLSLPALNKKADAETLMGVFDKGSLVELGASYCKEIKCCLGKIGGIAVAALIFGGGEEGVKMCACRARKINEFASLACAYNLPFITFVNTLGIKESIEVNDSPVIKELCDYVSILNCMENAKISVVYGKAIGLGYTLFSAKSSGYDFSYAFANAQIALFDGAQGAEIELAGSTEDSIEILTQKYSQENSDPVNAAKGGYIDNIIEPSFVRQYLIASLQMAIK